MVSKNNSSPGSQQEELGGLSMKKLEAGAWLLEHKKVFKKILIAFLIVVSVLTWGYNIYYTTKYLAIGMERDAANMRGITRRLVPRHDFFVQMAPDPIQISRVNVINTGDKADITAQVQNPNPHHYAYFSYCFNKGKKNIECGKDFLLPGQKKYVFALAKTDLNSQFNINFQIKGTNWDKLNAHRIPDWQEYKQKRLDLDFQDKEFIPAHSSGVSEELNLARLKFSVLNDSSYGYYQIPLKIVLYKGGKVVGVNKYVLTDFSSQEKKEVEITWPDIDINISEVEIRPDINILNSENFRRPGS